MLFGVGILGFCHWRLEVEVANVEASIVRSFSRNCTVEVELGSRQIGCRCDEGAFSNNFVSTNSNSDSVRLCFLRENFTYREKVCRSNVFRFLFPLDEESGFGSFESSVALGDSTPLIRVQYLPNVLLLASN